MTVRDGVVVELRRSEDRGAVAVEAALILPFLVLLFLGMVDLTLLIRDHVSATSLTRSGARVAASLPRFATDLPSSTTNPWGHGGQGDTSSFAQSAADAMQRAGSALPRNAIDFIWVYLPDARGSPWVGTATSACALRRVVPCTGGLMAAPADSPTNPVQRRGTPKASTRAWGIRTRSPSGCICRRRTRGCSGSLARQPQRSARTP